MIEDLIKKKGSVYRASLDTGIPYTTLNELCLGKKKPGYCRADLIAKIAEYLGVSVEELLHGQESEEAEEIRVSTSYEDARKKKYRFHPTLRSDLFPVERVHPLAQKRMEDILEALRDYPGIEGITLFGSSTNIRCHPGSDIDLCVSLEKGHDGRKERNEVSERIQEACGYTADVIWRDHVEPGSLLESNIALGVRVL